MTARSYADAWAPQQGTVRLRKARGGGAFQVLGVTAPAWLSVLPRSLPDGSWDLILIPNEQAPGKVPEPIRVQTDDPWLPWIVIPVSVPGA